MAHVAAGSITIHGGLISFGMRSPTKRFYLSLRVHTAAGIVGGTVEDDTRELAAIELDRAQAAALRDWLVTNLPA